MRIRAPKFTLAMFALAALAASQVTPARAFPLQGNLPVAAAGPADLVEGTRHVLYTFSVTNNSAKPWILDMALALITPPGLLDPTDFIVFSGVNGADGLVNYPAVLAAGETGKFIYSVDAPNPPDGNDFGINLLRFWVEYSEIDGAPALPTINADGPIVLLLGGQHSGTVDPAALATLQNCVDDPANCTGPADLLYPAAANNGRPTHDGAAILTVTVHDIPEPGTLALVLIAGLAARRGARRMGRPWPVDMPYIQDGWQAGAGGSLAR